MNFGLDILLWGPIDCRSGLCQYYNKYKGIDFDSNFFRRSMLKYLVGAEIFSIPQWKTGVPFGTIPRTVRTGKVVGVGRRATVETNVKNFPNQTFITLKLLKWGLKTTFAFLFLHQLTTDTDGLTQTVVGHSSGQECPLGSLLSGQSTTCAITKKGELFQMSFENFFLSITTYHSCGAFTI